MPMRILDLFSGIGGFSLGLHRASETFQTVAFCEQDPFCTQILNKHWPDVPVYPDIRELTYERLKADGVVADPENERKLSGGSGVRGIRNSRVQTTENSGGCDKEKGGNSRHHFNDCRHSQGKESTTNENTKGESGEPAERTIDIVCGGFPCQPFSQAGKRRGKDDDRDLWPAMFRIIKECQPRWVVGENVAGFVNMELDRTVSHLESEGYEVRTFVLGAVAVQAPHQRQRCWIIGRKRDVGNAQHDGFVAESELRSHDETSDKWGQKKQEASGQPARTSRSAHVPSLRGGECESERQDVADSGNKGLQGGKWGGPARKKRSPGGHITECDQDVADSGGTRSEAGLPGSDSGKERITKESNDRDHRQPRGEASDTRSTQRGMGYLADGLSARLLDIGSIWHIEPDIPRVTTGEKNRVKKLKALGNSVVPQIPEIIGRLIMEVEREI
jgi:DNA (cytosine-5)-methyltransferase 1